MYFDLAARYRDIAASLRAAADRMSAQRDLPMGAHEQMLASMQKKPSGRGVLSDA